ncbi:hypothetical protein [Nocardioides sp. TF02-7]|uniref:hypothetical protein n=1 Tax=Nocardioides sp. TF02-7 TaxID=2917724 RepID=UPI001F06DE42|nr:hypothetical protein [Nocardioides sp. TF02-7]UMG92571.1 hypothetical protein MF408_22655 [Nocardioides sp. TF02-7]
MPSRRRTAIAAGCAASALVAALLGTAPAASTAAAAADDDGPMLGLPSPRRPRSTSWRRAAERSARGGSPTSPATTTTSSPRRRGPFETAAHGLRSGTSDVATVAGVPVRRAGAGRPGGWFSYDAAGAEAEGVPLRVEGGRERRRALRRARRGATGAHAPDVLYAAQARPIGLTHYDVQVPARS